MLNKADIQPGDIVYIYGASGSIGIYAVQLARNFKARVTAVSDALNLELLKSPGAGRVLDYSKDDLSSTDDGYEVIFDTVGKFPKSRAKNLLTENGRYVSTHSSPVKEKQEYLTLIRELAEKRMIKAVIEKRYPLDKIEHAHAYAETGRRKGNVVIQIN